MPRKLRVSLDSLIPSPRKGPLSEDQKKRAVAIWETFKEVDPSSLEEVLANFERDLDSERELAVWEGMAKEYKEALPRLPTLRQKKAAFMTIIADSFKSHPIVVGPVLN